MYARRIKSRSLFQQSSHKFRSTQRGISQSYGGLHIKENFIRKFNAIPFPLPSNAPGRIFRICRCYSSEGKGSNASDFDKVKSGKEGVIAGSKGNKEHSSLGEQDQQEWINSERLSTDIKRKESPFLTKRDRFKIEFSRRVVPWENITVSWETFPYYIDQHAKTVLVECAASHLRRGKFAASYGSQLSSSSKRILLQSIPGTELYRERFVRALAHELQVSLLVLDSSILAPYDFGQGCTSESEAEDESEESGGECTSASETEGESDNDVDARASAEAIKKIIPCTLEEFAKRVSEEFKEATASAQSDPFRSVQDSNRRLQKGDRVKYVGPSMNIEAVNRIMLGKIPTSEGSTSAYTLISGRPLSKGQRGEVFEINGDQVAVILDSTEDEKKEENKDEIMKDSGKPSIYWFDIQDIVHDVDTQSEDWYIALEALCEVLPSLQPLIIFLPDSSEWFSRAVPKSYQKEFINKAEEMFNQLHGPVFFICGQNIVETENKEKEKFTMVLPHLGRIARLPDPLKQLTEGMRASSKSLKDNELSKLFPNTLFIHPPKDEEPLQTFNKQIEEDRRIILLRNNLVQLHEVLEDHGLSCNGLLHVKTEGLILTKRKTEKVVGWAKNHHLSSTTIPSVKGAKLIIPLESLNIAISRLREQETIYTKPSLNLKSLAKDEYESNFISAVVPPDEVGVKFDDIGALEDVKRTLNELVTLPMRRPELFSHGNLLRPCKGILLFGPPGTGKTLLAKALATEAGANFISITGSTLTSKWFGDAEKLTTALFSFASQLAPVIIFVDEVDSLLGARGGSFEHEATRRMRNEFMAAWDGLRSKDSQRILILGATNRPFDLDDAVIRRLPRRIYVDLPDAENRTKILRILLSQENLDREFRYEELANATEGYSGSDLKNLCTAAAYRPVQELMEGEKKGECSGTSTLRPLNLEDFIQAKAKVGASVAYDAASMNELRKWNDMYGEDGSRKKSPFGFSK